MGFWLFGSRKNRRDSKHQESGTGGAAHEDMARARSAQSKGDFQKSDTLANSDKRRPDRPKRLTKIDRSISRDSGPVAVPRSSTAPVAIKDTTSPSNARQKRGTFPTPPSNPFVSPSANFPSDVYQNNPASQSSLGQDHFTTGERPTLNAKRSSNDAGMPRRKKSKRRAEEREREQQIRALSSPIPIPKRSSLTGGLLRQDVKVIPGSLNRHFDRPASEISLPTVDSLTDSLHDMPRHQHSFKVNALDILAPRPTVRYLENPRYRSSRGTNISQSFDKRQVIPEEDLKSTKRIENLADSLDSSALRELMERDRKRKERKILADHEKLDRKLRRRAERQRLHEEQAAAGESSKAPEPGSSSQQQAAVGLGIGGEDLQSEEQQQSQHRAQLQTPESWLHDPSRENVASEKQIPDEKPSMSVQPDPPAGPGPDRSFLHGESPVDARMSQASIASASPSRSPARRPRDRSSMSQMSGLQREYTPDIPEDREVVHPRREFEQNSTSGSTWTSFFKRGGTRKKRDSADRGRTTPEFSNTSRESFPRQGPPPATQARTFRKSGTPVRTRSKFREDLPDFPLSPPDSRVQSPEAAVRPDVPSVQPVFNASQEESQPTEPGLDDETVEFESPHRGHTATLSQSLASVDSEGSWLSGRPAKRGSLGLAHPLRQSETSLNEKGHVQGEEEDLVNDEYLSRLSPGPESKRDSGIAGHRASSTILGQLGDSDEDTQSRPNIPRVPQSFLLKDPGTKLHEGLGKQATLIRQHDRAKSREGEVKNISIDSAGNSEDEERDIITPGEGEDRPPLFQAEGKHVRRISAGSARLLDVRRTSLDSNKRLSSDFAGQGVENSEPRENM